jgi:hypothetical protein
MEPINMIRLDAHPGDNGKIDPDQGATLTVTAPSGQTMYRLTREETTRFLRATALTIALLDPVQTRNDYEEVPRTGAGVEA